MQERLSSESSALVFSPNVTSKGNITNMQLLESSPASEIRTAEPSKTLPHPHFSNHGKIEKKIEPCKTMKEGTTKVGVNQVKPQMPTNPFAKASSNQERTKDKAKAIETTKVGSEQNLKEQVSHIPIKVIGEGISDTGSNKKQCTRPTNPFAKSSSNQDKSSLIDSIKKMRKAEHEKNERVSSKKAKS